MKKVVLAVLASMVLMLFTGCSVTGNFNRDYVVNEVNPYYSKVSNVPVTIIPSYGVISKASESAKNRAVVINLELNVGEINNNVSRIYFEQYFSNVRTENTSNKNGLIIKSTIKDFTYYRHFSGALDITILLEVVAEYNGKEILRKNYFEKFEDGILWQVLTVRINEKENVVDFFHKALLSLYENNVKKDLLQAL